MDRREALKSGLGVALTAAGVSEVKTISSGDDIELVILKNHNPVCSIDYILDKWNLNVKGTSLEYVPVIVLDGIDIEVVRKKCLKS